MMSLLVLLLIVFFQRDQVNFFPQVCVFEIETNFSSVINAGRAYAWNFTNLQLWWVQGVADAVNCACTFHCFVKGAVLMSSDIRRM